MGKKVLFSQIQTLLHQQHFGVLATQGSVYPYCSLVGFIATEDGQEIFFATMRDTHKYANLKKNPQVSLLIDSQTNKENDFKNAKALTVLGSVQEINNTSEAAVYFPLYIKRHPHLERFITDPDCAWIKIIVFKYILVNNFQDVLEYSVK